MLGATSAIDSAVVCHPGRCTIDQIKAMKVPTSWQCAEGKPKSWDVCSCLESLTLSLLSEDFTFGPSLKDEAEASFAARKGKENFVEYEFHDYKGAFNYSRVP